MSYHGDYRAGDTVDFKFSTVNTSAAPTTLSGATLSAYKSNSTTQTTTGVGVTVDFDGLTGLNHVRVTTASDGTFFADGNDFDIVITAGTVGGVSVVGMVVGSFSLANRSINAIKTKTDLLPGSPAAVGSAMTLTSGERDSVADALLDRNMATGTDSGGRTVRNALRFLRNRFRISGAALTVYKEDDATTAWTSTVTTTAGNPVSESDPA